MKPPFVKSPGVGDPPSYKSKKTRFKVLSMRHHFPKRKSICQHIPTFGFVNLQFVDQFNGDIDIAIGAICNQCL